MGPDDVPDEGGAQASRGVFNGKTFLKRRLQGFLMTLLLVPVVFLALRMCGPAKDTSTTSFVDPSVVSSQWHSLFAAQAKAMDPVVKEADGWIYEARSLRFVDPKDNWNFTPDVTDSFGRVVVAQVTVRRGPNTTANDVPPSFQWDLLKDPLTSEYVSTALWTKCPTPVPNGIKPRSADVAGEPGRVAAVEGTQRICWWMMTNQVPQQLVLALAEPDLDTGLLRKEPLSLGPTSMRFLMDLRPKDDPAAESPTPTK